MLAHRYRLPLSVIVAGLAAGGATVLLRPRNGLIEPAAASATDYFTAEQLQRARAFRVPQRALGFASLGLSGGLLVWLVARPPRGVARTLERAGAAPVAGGAAAAAAYAVGAELAGLPLAAVAHQRARRVGLATQAWGPWLGDVAKAGAIGAVMTGMGGAMAVGLIRRFPQRWWVPGSAAIVGLSALLAFASPVVIDPLFNKFEPLPEGPLRSEVLELARRAGVDVGEVFRVDASRRTTGTNAYVWGLGRTKRVVIYDTLIDGFPEDQVRSVVAHELSHVVSRDVVRSLSWLALVAPAATLLVKALAERFNPGRSLGTPAALPGLALAAALASGVLGPLGNALSRRVEARADTFALELTRDPDAFIELERSLTITNVAEPRLPRVLQLLFGTHPTTLERIGMALAWAGRS